MTPCQLKPSMTDQEVTDWIIRLRSNTFHGGFPTTHCPECGRPHPIGTRGNKIYCSEPHRRRAEKRRHHYRRLLTQRTTSLPLPGHPNYRYSCEQIRQRLARRLSTRRQRKDDP